MALASGHCACLQSPEKGRNHADGAQPCGRGGPGTAGGQQQSKHGLSRHVAVSLLIMHYLMQYIERYLMSCRELTAFCSQNGWIDPDSLYYEIIEQSDQHVIALVQFEEVLTQGAGAAAARVACQGHLRLTLDRYGQVSHAELL